MELARTSSPTTVLLVDDEPLILRFTRYLLERAGYTVFSSECALRALKILKEDKVDLVITDVMMPGLDGLEFFQKIQVYCPEVPVIFVTGCASFSDVQAVEMGAANLLHKPVMPDKLLASIQQALCRENQMAN